MAPPEIELQKAIEPKVDGYKPSVLSELLDGFFVYDERVGCVAVYRGPKWNCLEGIGDAAIYYRHGTWDGNAWDVPIEYLNEAKMVCQALNVWKIIRGAV